MVRRLVTAVPDARSDVDMLLRAGIAMAVVLHPRLCAPDHLHAMGCGGDTLGQFKQACSERCRLELEIVEEIGRRFGLTVEQMRTYRLSPAGERTRNV